jgi:hypothetical protein
MAAVGAAGAGGVPEFGGTGALYDFGIVPGDRFGGGSVSVGRGCAVSGLFASVSIPDGEMGFLIEALVLRLKELGVVIAPEPRVAPYTCPELAKLAQVSQSTIKRLVAEGTLQRVGATSRILITVDSAVVWMTGRGGKGGTR